MLDKAVFEIDAVFCNCVYIFLREAGTPFYWKIPAEQSVFIILLSKFVLKLLHSWLYLVNVFVKEYH